MTFSELKMWAIVRLEHDCETDKPMDNYFEKLNAKRKVNMLFETLESFIRNGTLCNK